MLSIAKARALYEGADPVHDFDHVMRVLRLAQRIALTEGADLSIVRPATLLHDVGREEAERTNADHAVLAAARAQEILPEMPEARTEAILHAIAAHRFRTPPRPSTLEAQVLFDADKLDAIGTVGVARAFAYGGAHGQRLWAPISAVDFGRWTAEGDDPDTHTPVHEYVVKLSRIRGHLFTQTGRSIAEARHQAMVAFFERMSREVRGEA